MELLLSIAQYLTEQGLCDGDGIDTFRDFMPHSPDGVVVLHEYNGDSISPLTDGVHRSVQVKVRDSDATVCRSKAVRICQAFMPDTEDRRVDFSDGHWGQVYVRQAPFKLTQDESNRVVYCFNLGITTNILE